MSLNNISQKKKIGLGVYYTSLILIIITLLYAIIFIKNDDLKVLSIIRYRISFYCFGLILPVGLIVREVCVDKYDLKKIIRKIIITFVTLVIGTIVFIVLNDNVQISLLMLFVSFALLMIDIVPTVKKENQ